MPTLRSSARRRDPSTIAMPLGLPTVAEPFLKWAGGKGQLLPILWQLRPKHEQQWSGDYYEPFMGSAAFFFHLKSQGAIRAKAHLGDTNKALVNCFDSVQRNPDAVLDLLQTHEAAYSRNRLPYYLNVRAQHDLDGIEAAARFIFLNRTCFNGLWRVNSKGHFNVPMGRYKDPLSVVMGRIIPASDALQQASITHKRFDRLAKNAKAGSFIYFDPPYDPLTKTAAFTAYTAEGFGEDEQVELRDLAIALRKQGSHVMLSNSSTPLTQKLYGDKKHFRLVEVPVRRAISASGTSRTTVKEIVVTTYAPQHA